MKEINFISACSDLGVHICGSEKGAENLDPSVIAAYVYETAKAFSKFYQTCSIVNAGEAKLAGARLYLAECTLQVIKNAMNLVLVPYLEKM